MSNVNIDTTTLGDALAKALKPLQDIQEKQLVMLTLNTLYAPEEIQQLSKDYQGLVDAQQKILAKIQDTKDRLKHGRYGNGDDVIEAKNFLFNKASAARDKTFDDLAEFECKHPLLVRALSIAKLL